MRRKIASHLKIQQSLPGEGFLTDNQLTRQPETSREKEMLARYVLLANEIDRLQAINFQLIRENEELHSRGSQFLSSNRLNTTSSEKETDFRSKLTTLLVENERLNTVIKTLSLAQNSNKSIEELENKIRILINENARIAQLLENGTAENNTLKYKISHLETSAPQHNINSYLQEIDRLKSELDKWKGKVVDLDLQAYQSKDLQNRVQALLSENERLREQVEASNKNARSRENSRLEVEQLNLIINQKNLEIQNLVKQFEECSREMLELRTVYHDFENAKFQIDDLKNKIKLIVADNERLYEESYTLVAKLNEAEVRVTQKEQLEGQISYLRTEIERQNQAIAQLSKAAEENPILKQKNQDLEAKLRIIVNENQRIADEMVEAQRQVESEQAVRAQVEGLQQDLTFLTQENEGLSKRLSESLEQNENLKNQIVDLLTKVQKLGEYESQARYQNESLLEKLQIIEDYRAKIAQLEQQANKTDVLKEKLKAVMNENSKSSAQLLEKNIEIDNLKAKASQAEGLIHQVQDLQNKLGLILQENERLNEVLIGQHKEFEVTNAKAVMIGELQTKVTFYQEELEKCRRELDVLRSRLLTVEGSEKKLQEFNQILAHTRSENQRLEKDLAEARSKLFSQANLEAQVRGKLEAEKQIEKESIISSLHNKSTDLEQKIYLLLQENEKLAFVNEERLNELEAWKARLDEAERFKNEQIEQLKLQYNAKAKYEIEFQLKSYKEKSEGEIAKLKSSLTELERRYNFLASENETLKESNRSKYNEVEEYKKKYYDLELIRMQEIEDFKYQFDGFKKSSLLKFNAERAAYEAQILQLNQRVQESEKQINELLVEIEKHTQLTSDKTKESENWRYKLAAIEGNYQREVFELKSQLEQFKATNHDVKQLTLKYGSEKASDQSQIKQLKQLVENYKGELTRLYELVSQKKKNYEALHQEHEALKKNYEEKQQQLIKSQDLGDVIQNLEALNLKIKELEESRELYKRQAERNNLELTKKNKELVEKIQELDFLKVKYEDALNNYQDLSAQLFEKLTKSA